MTRPQAQDVETNCTAIIKAFERPDKLIDLVGSIRRAYPALKIIIVDDSKNPMSFEWDSHTEYHHVAYDIGLAAGRNIAVSYVQTPYTLLLDDDFLFTEHTKIENFLRILEEENFDIVGGDVIDHGKQKRLFRGDYKVADNKLHLRYKLGRKIKGQYPRFDFIVNFFLAKTDTLVKYPWDNDLKIREHEVFFWRLRQAKVRVTYTNTVSVFHFPEIFNLEDKAAYHKKRHDRLAHFHKLACEKLGFDDFVTDGGAYEGPLGLFKIYAVFVSWMREHKDDTIFIKLLWVVWNACRPLLKLTYRMWQKLKK